MKNFELFAEDEVVRMQFRFLLQVGRVAPYVQKFRELQCRLPSMTKEEIDSTSRLPKYWTAKFLKLHHFFLQQVEYFNTMECLSG